MIVLILCVIMNWMQPGKFLRQYFQKKKIKPAYGSRGLAKVDEFVENYGFKRPSETYN
ncbi:hypothetical protein C2G38_2319605 [Gigaspora rosea]|uniref:Uncharacterized protein n=1 Tax=Gigaspora rosea TaxID=44941 RepID=A0A397UZ23_9GLOM|nr:hypothetical protein C2G38_2319605 [Gigaspora rosea]